MTIAGFRLDAVLPGTLISAISSPRNGIPEIAMSHWRRLCGRISGTGEDLESAGAGYPRGGSESRFICRETSARHSRPGRGRRASAIAIPAQSLL
jgi:hypothetical protein